MLVELIAGRRDEIIARTRGKALARSKRCPSNVEPDPGIARSAVALVTPGNDPVGTHGVVPLSFWGRIEPRATSATFTSLLALCCAALACMATLLWRNAPSITFVAGSASTNRRVASMPLRSGIEMSISTTSGSSCWASSTPSRPFSASPTTSSPAFSRIARSPSRIRR
jgi:hypothetical protein